MTSLEKVQALLPEMTYYEKLSLLEQIAQDLNNTWPGIESTPGICGGVARIEGTRIPVWTLVGYKLLGASDITLLQAYPTLSADDLSHAWGYYREHKAQIDQQIAENEAE